MPGTKSTHNAEANTYIAEPQKSDRYLSSPEHVLDLVNNPTSLVCELVLRHSHPYSQPHLQPNTYELPASLYINHTKFRSMDQIMYYFPKDTNDRDWDEHMLEYLGAPTLRNSGLYYVDDQKVRIFGIDESKCIGFIFF